MRLVLRTLRLVGLLLLFALAVWLVATGGQLFFYLPSVAAKRVTYALTGASEGPIAMLLFVLFATLYVTAIGGILFTIVQPFNRRRA
ncbi:MAG: hypothetical protein KatS3mg060_0085 [Dehalococcoidia bacterium]|nr:MAG: hypothetical protein KatS3mg060_0085 [Dehalococcoidia bacterium]